MAASLQAQTPQVGFATLPAALMCDPDFDRLQDLIRSEFFLAQHPHDVLQHVVDRVAEFNPVGRFLHLLTLGAARMKHGACCVMRKQHLLSDQTWSSRAMSAVLLASGYARRLVECEARRSNLSITAAIPIVARRVKASPGSLWGLLFRQPKRICSDLMDSLEEAVTKEIRREIAELEKELAAVVATRSAFGGLNRGTVEEIEADLDRLRRVIGEVRA